MEPELEPRHRPVDRPAARDRERDRRRRRGLLQVRRHRGHAPGRGAAQGGVSAIFDIDHGYEPGDSIFWASRITALQRGGRPPRRRPRLLQPDPGRHGQHDLAGRLPGIHIHAVRDLLHRDQQLDPVRRGRTAGRGRLSAPGLGRPAPDRRLPVRPRDRRGERAGQQHPGHRPQHRLAEQLLHLLRPADRRHGLRRRRRLADPLREDPGFGRRQPRLLPVQHLAVPARLQPRHRRGDQRRHEPGVLHHRRRDAERGAGRQHGPPRRRLHARPAIPGLHRHRRRGRHAGDDRRQAASRDPRRPEPVHAQRLRLHPAYRRAEQRLQPPGRDDRRRDPGRPGRRDRRPLDGRPPDQRARRSPSPPPRPRASRSRSPSTARSPRATSGR